jgi:hypothetical protein
MRNSISCRLSRFPSIRYLVHPFSDFAYSLICICFNVRIESIISAVSWRQRRAPLLSQEKVSGREVSVMGAGAHRRILWPGMQDGAFAKKMP